MNIQAEKLEMIRMLLNTRKPSVLASIRRIFEKEDIRQGIEELDNGKKFPYEEIMAKHR
jgi:hypothetical protein